MIGTFFTILCLTLAAAPPLLGPQFPTPSFTQEYSRKVGQTNVGRYDVNQDPHCHKVDKVILKEKCEPYTQTTCTTESRKECKPTLVKNCTGVIDTNMESLCINVMEHVCSLIENVHYEMVEETYQVENCSPGQENVCDTSYAIDKLTKEEYQCCNVEILDCFKEFKNINDVTCTDTVEFDCIREKSPRNDDQVQTQVVCKRTPTQNCYNISKKVQVEVCKTDVRRYCEKFSNVILFPVEKYHCHDEPKKICKLETKTRPKKIEKYSYVKDCKEVSRELCPQYEKKSLKPVCENQEVLTCVYKPVEDCKDEYKHHCYKEEEVVVEEVCV